MKDKIIITGLVQEMSASTVKVPFSPKVDVEKLTEGDTDPMFVTVEVASATVSRNNNRYSTQTLHEIADQINSDLPDAYMGHLDDKERPSKYPDPQTMWVGAIVQNIDGVDRLFAKGYVYADSRIRTLLKKATAAGKTLAVSVYGTADRMFDKAAKVYDIINYKLESLDWARPGAQGLTPKFFPAITQEQVIDMTKEELLKELTLEDLKNSRADLVEALKKEIEAEKEPINEPVVTPPTEEDETTKEMVEVKELLGITDQSVKEVVSEMVENNRTIVAEMKDLLEEHIDNQLAKEIKNPALRGVVKEMVKKEITAWNKSTVDNVISTVLQSSSTKELIAEMSKETHPNPLNTPSNSGTGKYITK